MKQAMECKYEDKIIQTGEAMVEIKTDIKYIKKEQSELRKDIHEFISCADKKYASKSFEVRFYWAMGVIFTAIVSAGIYWLFNIR